MTMKSNTPSTQTIVLISLVLAIAMAACIPTEPRKNLAGEAFKFIIDGKELQESSFTVIKGVPKQVNLEISWKAEKATFDVYGNGKDIEIKIGADSILKSKGIMSGDNFIITDFQDKSEITINTPESVTIPISPIASVLSASLQNEIEKKGETKEIPFLSISYFPLNAENKLDTKETWVACNGEIPFNDMGGEHTEKACTPDAIRNYVNKLNHEGMNALTKASAYHGYKETSKKPFVKYKLHESKESLTAPPKGPKGQIPWNLNEYRPDYFKILTEFDICNYVDNKGVKEVWFWSYDNNIMKPVESNMAMGKKSKQYWNYADYGDVSNSERSNDLPICDNTYVLFNYNYGRGLGELLEDHGHHIENVLRFVDDDLFWNKFVNPYGQAGTNHCGWTHAPPNTEEEYKWNSNTQVMSDCEDWKPDGTGQAKPTDCNTWYGAACLDNGGVEFKIWWMQNIPGEGNTLSYNGKQIKNWWQFITDFDNAVKEGKELTTSKKEEKTETTAYLNGKQIKEENLNLIPFLTQTTCETQPCQIKLDFTSDTPTTIKLSNLKLEYKLKTKDLAPAINSLCKEYPCTVPITFTSLSDGEILLKNMEITEKQKSCSKNAICEAEEDEKSCPDDCYALKGTKEPSLEITIAGKSPGKLPKGSTKVTIKKDSTELAEFTFDFSKGQLDISELQIEQQKTERSVVWVKGLELGEKEKIIHLPKIKEGLTKVCIKDAEINSLEELSKDCTGQDEQLLPCDGIKREGYTCESMTGSFKVSGLKHSAVFEPEIPEDKPEPLHAPPLPEPTEPEPLPTPPQPATMPEETERTQEDYEPLQPPAQVGGEEPQKPAQKSTEEIKTNAYKSQQKETIPLLKIIFPITALAVAILLILALIKLKQKKQNNASEKRLIKYITTRLSTGADAHKIANELIKAGWQREKVYNAVIEVINQTTGGKQP